MNYFLPDVTARAWSFQTAQYGSGRPYVTFLTNGIVAGLGEDYRWSTHGGVLDLRRADGTLVYRFDVLTLSANGATDLAIGTDQVGHGALLHAEPVDNEGVVQRPRLHIRHRACSKTRRNLVVLRANEMSLHPRWWKECKVEREWDFALSFYGQLDNFGRDEFAELQILQEANRKYHAIYDLFYEGSPFWEYDYIAFPDDDMLTTCGEINRMFDYARRFELLLSQPALSGHVTHPITRADPAYLLRFTSFVEPIAPWFSRAALHTCRPTFTGTLSGYGLDHIWPKLLGEPQCSIAVVDDIIFEHTRPVAQNYDMNAALAEGWEFQMRFGAFPKEVDFGGIYRIPIDRFQKW